MSFDPSTRYRDRIESGGRHYNNPYRQDLWAQNSYKATLQRSKDQMETHNQRVERQLIEKFQKNNFKAISGGFTAIVHLGKGIVLILVAPPYFLLFIMPRWAFQTLMPAAEKAGEFLEKSFLRVSAWTVDIFGAFSTKIAEFRSRMKKQKKEPKPTKEHELDPRLISMNEKLKNFASSLGQLGKNVSQSLATLRNRLFDQLHRLNMSVVKKTAALIQSGKQVLAHVLEQVQVRLMNVFKPALTMGAKVLATIDKTLEKVVHAVSTPIKRVFEEAAKVIKPVVHAAIVTTQFVQGILAHPFQFVTRQVAAVANAANAAVAKAATALQKSVTAIAQSLNIFAQVAFKPVANAAAFLTQAAERGIVSLAQRGMNLSKVVVSVMQRAVESCLEKGKQGAKKFLQWSSGKAKIAAKAALNAVMTLKYLPGYLWQMARFVWRLISRVWRKFSHGIRVMYVLTKHLVRQSLVQLERSLHKTQ